MGPSLNAQDMDHGGSWPEDSESRRQSRLLFWSVLILDHVVSIGHGRHTAFRSESITQSLPAVKDLRQADSHASSGGDHTSTTPSPFPHAARLMFSYGSFINLLNVDDEATVDLTAREDAIKQELRQLSKGYNDLPFNMRWSAEK